MPGKAFFELQEEQQRKILDAAISEFVEYKDNYEKSSIKRIAANAGISIGSFYKYFESKEDLFFYLYTLNKKNPMALPSDTFYSYSCKDKDFMPRLSEVGEILIDMLSHNAILFQAYTFHNATTQEYLEKIMPYLENDEKRGLLNDNVDKNIAAYMYLTIEFLAYQYCSQYDIDFSKDTKVMQQMMDLFFFGLYRKKE